MSNIQVYETNGPLRTRSFFHGHYTIESAIKPSREYVLSPEEVALIDTDLTLRIPMDTLAELAEIYEEVKDLKNRGILGGNIYGLQRNG